MSTELYKVVEGDNFGGDYPNERFVNIPATTQDKAQAIADAINAAHCPTGYERRWWRVEPEHYRLQPGFTP